MSRGNVVIYRVGLFIDERASCRSRRGNQSRTRGGSLDYGWQVRKVSPLISSVSPAAYGLGILSGRPKPQLSRVWASWKRCTVFVLVSKRTTPIRLWPLRVAEK